VCIPQGKTALIAPKRNLRLWWQAGSEQLILKVPLALFEELRAVGQPGPLDMPSLFLLPQQAAPHWDLLIQSLLRVLALPGQSEGHGEWIRHFERSAAQFLLSQLTGTVQPVLAFPAARRSRPANPATAWSAPASCSGWTCWSVTSAPACAPRWRWPTWPVPPA
jgi:hypothetical protein